MNAQACFPGAKQNGSLFVVTDGVTDSLSRPPSMHAIRSSDLKELGDGPPQSASMGVDQVPAGGFSQGKQTAQGVVSKASASPQLKDAPDPLSAAEQGQTGQTGL